MRIRDNADMRRVKSASIKAVEALLKISQLAEEILYHCR